MGNLRSNLIRVAHGNETLRPHLLRILKQADVIEQIARRVLGIPSLQSRNRDSLDFRDVGVALLRIAMLQAYEAGGAEDGVPDEALLEKIAKRHGVDTLRSRGSDRLDFKDMSVGQIRSILEEAYAAGQG